MAGTATPRKRAPRKAPAARAATPPAVDLSYEDVGKLYAELESTDGPFGPDGEIRPIEIGKRGRSGIEQVHIFTLDDVKYFVPRRPGPAVTLKFQRNLRRMSKDAAVMETLLDLLGENALDKLATSPEVQPEDFADVILVVSRILFDALQPIQEASDPS